MSIDRMKQLNEAINLKEGITEAWDILDEINELLSVVDESLIDVASLLQRLKKDPQYGKDAYMLITRLKGVDKALEKFSYDYAQIG